MSMTWNDITVHQYQEIYKLANDNSIDDIDKIIRTICILHNRTEHEVDEMKLTDFNKLATECGFLLTDKVPGKAKTSIRIGSKKYAINYKPSSLKHRQYVELLHFGDKPIENMHFIMASIVNQVKWFRKWPNTAELHPVIAEDMLNAKIVDVFHSCVFFCKLFSSSIKAIQDYLKAEMMSKGMNEKETNQLLTHLKNATDGLITPAK